METVKLTYMLTSGVEVHSPVMEISEEDIEDLRDYLSGIVHINTEYTNLKLDRFVDDKGQEVEYHFNPAHVIAFKITYYKD